MDTVARIKTGIAQLIDHGIALVASLEPEQRKQLEKPIKEASFKLEYQGWYTRAFAVVRDVLPHRLSDFEALYQLDKRREVNIETYGISDYLAGTTLVHHDSKAIVAGKFVQQFLILKACLGGLDDALLNIRQLVHADFFDSELDEARELLGKGFLRAAGALAGVALEKHLGIMATQHEAAPKKKDPSIADLNDALKQTNVYDTPTWRFVSRLGDLRNLCDHNKKREPAMHEIEELIDGVAKIGKSVR